MFWEYLVNGLVEGAMVDSKSCADPLLDLFAS